MKKENLFTTIIKNPNWGYCANLFGVISFAKDCYSFFTSKSDYVMFPISSLINMVWLFSISVFLVQLLKIIKSTKQTYEDLKIDFNNQKLENKEELLQYKYELRLIHKMQNLKFKYSGNSRPGNDGRNYPMWIFHYSDFFSDKEFIDAIRYEIFTEAEKNIILGLGIISNYTIQ